MPGANEASRSRLRLGLLMKRIDVLYQEILDLERECPAPSLEEFMAMEAGTKPYSYEVFFLGLVGEIAVFLDEAVEALWKGYRRYNFSNFRTNLRCDSRLTDRAAFIVQKRRGKRPRPSWPGSC